MSATDKKLFARDSECGNLKYSKFLKVVQEIEFSINHLVHIHITEIHFKMSETPEVI